MQKVSRTVAILNFNPNYYQIHLPTLFFTEDQIKLVYEKAIGQSNCKEWKRQRTSRITVSRFKEIYSCAERLYIGELDEHPLALTVSVMGYSEYLQTWQMKHRLNTEVHANAKFKQIFKKLHKNCTFKDPGMTICERFFFISVSSDLEVCCSSHGERLVEIKCLGTLIGKIPNSENYSTHI